MEYGYQIILRKNHMSPLFFSSVPLRWDTVGSDNIKQNI
jgi:hypothetical protein